MLPAIEELVPPTPPDARHSEGNVRPVHSRPMPSVRPSPARAKPHDPDTWFPLVALEVLLAPESTDAPPAPPTDLTRTTRQDPESFSPETWAPEIGAPEIGAPEDFDPEPPRRRPPASTPRPAPKTAPRREQLAQRRRALTKRSRRSGVIILAVATTAAVVALGAPRLLAGPSDHEVTVSVDGELITAQTSAETVGAFLAEQNIEIGTFDSVEPPPGAEIDGGMAITVVRAFSVTVDIDGTISTLPTSKPTAGQLRDQLGLDPETFGIKDAPAELAEGATVVFRTFKTVKFRIDDAKPRERTMADTVGEFLGDYSVVLGPEDRVEPAPETPITDGMTVTVSRVNSRTKTMEVAIAPPTDYRDDYYTPAGQERVVEEGAPGVMRVTCRKEIVDGVKGECVTISEVPIVPPVPRIVIRGAGGTASTQTMEGVREGTASWYASPFGDNSCATKEWIPRGTVLTVTNVDTGQSATCVVADRVEAPRVVDLDDDVFAQLAPLSQGVFNVRISGI